MPLSHLVQHFNSVLAQQQDVVRQLPKTYFYSRDGQFFARFGSQDFGNHFLPIKHSADKSIVGYESQLWVRTALGNQIPVEDVFNALSNLDEVVFLDRITRTLQALNFSLLPDRHDVLLSLGIQSRHILGVPSGHGRTFDALLNDCGLASAKVLLHTPIPAPENFAHFRRALFSYSAFSYQVGIQIGSQQDWDHYNEWNVSADYLMVQADTIIPQLNSAGPKVIIPVEGGFELRSL